MKKILLLLVFSCLLFSKSNFEQPYPTFDQPRKVVMQLYKSDLKTVNQTLNVIYNIQKEYPSESLQITVVAYGDGMRAIKKDYDEQTLLRITSLMEYEVEFIGCRNTMETLHWVDKDFIDGVSFVKAGIVEVIEKKVSGYIGVVPF